MGEALDEKEEAPRAGNPAASPGPNTKVNGQNNRIFLIDEIHLHVNLRPGTRYTTKPKSYSDTADDEEEQLEEE